VEGIVRVVILVNGRPSRIVAIIEGATRGVEFIREDQRVYWRDVVRRMGGVRSRGDCRSIGVVNSRFGGLVVVFNVLGCVEFGFVNKRSFELVSCEGVGFMEGGRCLGI